MGTAAGSALRNIQKDGDHIKNKILQSFFIWSVFSSGLGTAIAFYVSPVSGVPFRILLLGVLISTHLISIFSAITGYSLGYRLRAKNYQVAMLIIVPATFLAAIIACGIDIFIIETILGYPILILIQINITRFLIPIFIINISITLAISWIMRLKYKKEELEKNIYAIQAELALKDEPTRHFLSIREKGNLYRLPYDDIIYISSHGKKTSVHTDDRDYVISAVMKDVDKKLSSSIFMRIHKQFIVNMRYVSHIRYYLGGRYLLFLKDKDENTLPVGIKYTEALKNKLGL